MKLLALPHLVASAPTAGVTADFSHDNILIIIVKAVLILVFALVSVLMAIWFERRVVGRMQSRPGPNIRGPFGLLQSINDALKLLLKEDMNVSRADKIIYIIAPMISVFASLLTFAVIPVGPNWHIPGTSFSTPLQLTDFPVAALYILAVTSIGVYGIVLGGWSSGSTYPLIGSVRSTAQIISYELAMGLSMVTVFLTAGSMSTSTIVSGQTKLWYCVMLMPSFVIYVIAMVGETNRLPFDLPEAEGELVGGYTTEYSSMKFAWFFLAEYINVLNVSAVATTLFLGGWHAPWPLSAIDNGILNTGLWPILWFVVKTWLLFFFFVWVRGTLIRFRYDQFMKLGWKVLIPCALGWLVLLSVIKAVDAFTSLHFSFWFVPIVAVLIIVFPILYTWPEKPKPEKKREGPPEVIDPYAGGFPVPPLPGQVLPPSPRQTNAADTIVGSVVSNVEASDNEKEDADVEV